MTHNNMAIIFKTVSQSDPQNWINIPAYLASLSPGADWWERQTTDATSCTYTAWQHIFGVKMSSTNLKNTLHDSVMGSIIYSIPPMWSYNSLRKNKRILQYKSSNKVVSDWTICINLLPLNQKIKHCRSSSSITLFNCACDSQPGVIGWCHTRLQCQGGSGRFLSII